MAFEMDLSDFGSDFGSICSKAVQAQAGFNPALHCHMDVSMDGNTWKHFVS